MRIMALLAFMPIFSACPVEADPKSAQVEPDDTDAIAVDSAIVEWDNEPYRISGRVVSIPLRISAAGGNSFVLMLSGPVGSLFSDAFTPIRCIGADCQYVEFRAEREFLCRLGNPRDWTGREVCTLVPLPPPLDTDQDTDAIADPSETDDDEADSDLPTDKDPPPAP